MVGQCLAAGNLSIIHVIFVQAVCALYHKISSVTAVPVKLPGFLVTLYFRRRALMQILIILKGIILHQFRGKPAVCRTVDILIKDAVQFLADIHTLFRAVNSHRIFCHFIRQNHNLNVFVLLDCRLIRLAASRRQNDLRILGRGRNCSIVGNYT